jgi:hypothetical protein
MIGEDGVDDNPCWIGTGTWVWLVWVAGNDLIIDALM